jgi:hypothetical protein
VCQDLLLAAEFSSDTLIETDLCEKAEDFVKPVSKEILV